MTWKTLNHIISWLKQKESQAQNENIHQEVDLLAELQVELAVDLWAEPTPSQEETQYLDLLLQADEAFLVMIAFQDPVLHLLEDHPDHQIHKSNKMEA